MFLPLTKAEQNLNGFLRFCIYGFFLTWCFMGVAIVADKFMGAIEAITSRRKQIKSKKTSKTVTVSIWNRTVANLTLMALGSSAPEILLSVIELFRNKLHSGELGPSTILGSASFNLMVIIGLCVVVIPNGESRRVHQVEVMYITTAFSLPAYLWMVIIIQVITPNIIDPWEAIVTLLLFPVLVFVSYLADVGKLQKVFMRRKRWQSKEEIPDEVVDRGCELLGHFNSDTRVILRQVLYDHPHLGSLADPDLQVIQDLWTLASEQTKQMCASRAARRQEAMRWLTSTKPKEQKSQLSECSNFMEFSCPVVYAHPQSTDVKLVVNRHGEEAATLEITYSVSSVIAPNPVTSSAVSVTDKKVRRERSHNSFSSVDEMAFGPTVMEGSFRIDSNESFANLYVKRPGPEESSFDVRLTSVRPAAAKRVPERLTSSNQCPTDQWHLGERFMVRVEPMKSDSKGLLSFPCERIEVVGQQVAQGIEVVVQRLEGFRDIVGCAYRTERLTAVPGYDYVETAGTLVFEEGVAEQRIPITILPKKAYEQTDEFLVVLEEPSGGARFDPRDDGGCDSTILTVTLVNNQAGWIFLRWLDFLVNLDELLLGTNDWKDQFFCAIYCNGSAEEQAEATTADWVFHIVALPWKLAFAFLPPTTYFAGWPCFWMSLATIALVTAIIGDLAELFGCVLGVPNAVTAVTFVAMGTSMPDLFASWAAATQDATADASICNVTGSNSVNVFLGLGIPWTIASLYWTSITADAGWSAAYGPDSGTNMAALLNNEPAFVVLGGGNLGFSVAVFLVFSASILLTLFFRRHCIGAELGGPRYLKALTCAGFFTTWVCYTALVCWAAIRLHEASRTETIGIFILLVGTAVACLLLMLVWTWRERGWTSEEHASVKQEAAQAAANFELRKSGSTISGFEEAEGVDC